jgi:hypothetical protein
MSIQPGVQQYCEVSTPRAIGGLESITQDAMTPVEYGRVAGASKYTETASSGDEIPGS